MTAGRRNMTTCSTSTHSSRALTEPYFKVRLVQMSGIWPTAPREFIVLSVRKDEGNGTVYMCSRSPTHHDIEPQSKGYVRGQVQSAATAWVTRHSQTPAALQAWAWMTSKSLCAPIQSWVARCQCSQSLEHRCSREHLTAITA